MNEIYTFHILKSDAIEPSYFNDAYFLAIHLFHDKFLQVADHIQDKH